MPPVTRDEAISFLRSDWQKTPDLYAYLNQGQENLFVVIPEGEAFGVRIRVQDTFGILGLMGKARNLELDFGYLNLTDVEYLLRHFYEGNYPALRSLHRGMRV